ncbi:YitT family protein [Anaerotignum sp. MB30-C6]|uniref:YitT family protein n=1 Tax=Anaerotignum sp. MB30-C6 TaxID=3070814 RepID=UPI0027DB22CE|nr:YitT family protein [Anaerotignum sp. MB30-C6]WMI81532.1 YitT family protein [Anaerotignum sp. MB30-C6]
MNGKKIEDLILRIFGTGAMALGFQCFLEPAHLVAGGVTGIGIMLNAFTSARFGFPTPLWLVNVALNFPLFLAALKMQGGRFVGRTIMTSLLFSLMLFLAQGVTFYTGDLTLSSVYGGVLVGIGLGLVLRCGATTGGVDLAAYLLQKFWSRPSLPKKIFIMDAVIILSGMIMFGGINGLYAILSVFISERCMKWVLEGGDVVRGAIVISHKAREIGEALNLRLEREVAAFSGKGTLGEPKKEILFCIFSQKEIQGAKSIIMNIDKNAILLVTDIREVLGEGVTIK